jgi:anion-transporting  ArsA/GET3 family ATPase
MIDLDTEVIVCIGSGGVGKTTVSASLGVWAALQGKKVLVLTVDPARRLATTFGLKPDGSEQRIVFPEAKGELWASVLNSKQTFDDFVRKAANLGANAQGILKNKLYQQLSTTLSGSQEFTALEKLYSAYESKQYDLIILDTPPTKHAIDFLKAPQKISVLFSEPIAKWFKQSKATNLMQQILQVGTQKVLQALQTLTGSEFVMELKDFFVNIEGWQSRLEDRTQRVNRLLLSDKTLFNLVTAFDTAKIEEAKAFAKEIRLGGYKLGLLTINRSYPNWLPKPFGTGSDTDRFCISLNHYYEARLKDFHGLTGNINDLEILMLPEYDQDIADLNGLKLLVRDYKWTEPKKAK